MNQRNKAPRGPKDPWSVVCLAAAVVLWGNFLLCLALAIGAIGFLLVELGFAVATALLLVGVGELYLSYRVYRGMEVVPGNFTNI